MGMDRSIARLHEGRVQKIIDRVRREKVEIPEAFILANYKNTAAYGKYNTQHETNRIIKLYYGERTMNQTKKAPPTDSKTLAAALAHAEALLTRAKALDDYAKHSARHAAECLVNAQVQADVARNALGKAKLTEAIALVDKVGEDAPQGSEASNDIDALAHRLMQRNVNRVFKDMPHEGIFARPATKYPAYVGPTERPREEGKSATAAAIDSMVTAVGAGQPRQAKPTARQYKVGDKVRLLKAWFPGAKDKVGSALTVSKVSVSGNSTFLYFVEFPGGQNCALNYVEPLVFKVGDKVQLNPARCDMTGCTDTAVLTVTEVFGRGEYIRVAEHAERMSGHKYDARAFDLVAPAAPAVPCTFPWCTCSTVDCAK